MSEEETSVENGPRPRSRTIARVHRIQGERAWCTLDRWCAGAVLVPVPTARLTQASGLPSHELPGTRFTVAVYLDALLDSDLQPTEWVSASHAPAA